MSNKGAIAAGHPETVRAAAAVLDDGGNAVDAALAGMCAACIAEVALASLGGGGFLLARPASGRHAGRSVVYDFFPQTPKRRRPEAEVEFFPVLADFGPAQQEFHVGHGSMATPGTVAGLFAAHADLGRMPMRDVVAPAVALAREGVRLSGFEAYILGVLRAILTCNDTCRRVFCRPDGGDLLAEGDVLRLPAVADALETLAIEGPDLFYRGEIGAALAAASAAHGGHLTADDLAGYQAIRRPPLRVAAFGGQVETNPPPSSGGIRIALALSLLDGLDMAAHPFGGADYATLLSRVMAAIGTAQLAGEAGGGPDVAAGTATVDGTLDAGLVARYRAEVLGQPAARRGTTHISVIDGEGGAAGLTVSNGEGSTVLIPGTDIMVNNMLGEENINPDGFHRWPTDRRLGSMMAPTLIEDRGGLTVLGSGGSNRLRSAILQVIVNLSAFAVPLPEAVERPRLHREGDRVSLEPGFDPRAVEALEAAGAEVEAWPDRNMFFGGVHAVRRAANGHIEGVGDPRRAGASAVL